jgi:hypothetical protein
MRTQPNRAYTLRNGEVFQQVDALRLAIADRAVDSGIDGPLLRKSAVWKFRTARNGTHFFVTSSHLQNDMKGTVHPTEAHFGFSRPDEKFDKWIGPKPASRHLHRLKVRNLKDGEHQHIFVIHLPGFALLRKPLPFDEGKIVTWSDPHPSDCEVTFSLTIVQGDWTQFVAIEGQFVTVGLLTGADDRHALISFGVLKYEDKEAAIANMQRNLGLIQGREMDPINGELTALLWMDRQEDEPVRIIELSGVRATNTAA